MRDGTVGLNLEGVLFALVLLSALYWLGALVCTAAFARRTRSGPGWTPPVSVLKPLLKDDGYLYDNLRSFCEQDYPVFEVLFVVADSDMRVGPDYLGAVVAPLRDASVGLVTCLYKSVTQRDLGSTFA